MNELLASHQETYTLLEEGANKGKIKRLLPFWGQSVSLLGSWDQFHLV